MSKAIHKMTNNLSARELKARVARLTKAGNRAMSQDELQVLFAWIDAVLFDYYLVQGILDGKICVHLPAEEVTTVEQFVDAMKVDVARRAKPHFN